MDSYVLPFTYLLHFNGKKQKLILPKKYGEKHHKCEKNTKNHLAKMALGRPCS